MVVIAAGFESNPSPSCSGHEGLGSGRVDRLMAWGHEQSATAMQQTRHSARTSANHALPPGSTWDGKDGLIWVARPLPLISVPARPPAQRLDPRR